MGEEIVELNDLNEVVKKIEALLKTVYSRVEEFPYHVPEPTRLESVDPLKVAVRLGKDGKIEKVWIKDD